MELKDGPYGLPCIEEGSTIVLATNSMEGAIIIGKQTVILVGNGECVSVSPPALVGEEPIQIACQIGRKKASTYLLGDCQGNLYILSVLKGIKVTRIGSMTFASSMTYLDNGVVFIGSCVSDSQLIQLNKKPVDNAYFTVLETYANIGPIIDMELFDAKSQDWPRMITCSGCDKWGSLRVLTNGIEIDEICALPFSRFKSAFPLKLSMNCNGKDDSLMFSNFEQSVILEQQDNGFALCKAECFIRDASTLYVGNVVYDQVLQISKKEIRLIRVKDLKAICLFISCLTIYFLNFLTPLRLTEENGIGPANVMAVSFWNETTIELYSLPDFKFIAKDSFDFKTLIRSIVFMEFKPNFVYLLVAMGAGTSPINLVPFWMKGSSIHQDLVPGGDKIVNYPPLTEPHEKVTISRISDISAINIVTVPIFEEPRKIVYQQDLGVFGLLTIRAESQAIRSEHFQKPQNQRPYSTGLITEIGEEPTSGRVVLYQFCDNVLTLVTECSTKGSVQCIDVHNELIICCVTHSVAKSSNTEWLTAVAIVDKDNYLYCNMDGCLCIATYPTDSPIRNELLNLEISLAFNLDQHVNMA
ncbi:hypothetical protein MXB_5715 [Myxobolus squamalis]|nr:hypothetical protein MXB_5715 [Myxobolus squamalis]